MSFSPNFTSFSNISVSVSFLSVFISISFALLSRPSLIQLPVWRRSDLLIFLCSPNTKSVSAGRSHSFEFAYMQLPHNPLPSIRSISAGIRCSHTKGTLWKSEWPPCNEHVEQVCSKICAICSTTCNNKVFIMSHMTRKHITL